jgi:diacylglycerol O-acyltransferase
MPAATWGKGAEPGAGPDRLQTYGQYGIGLLAELAKLLAMPPDSPTSLKGHTGTVKRVAWAEPMPLAEVKALGKALGCSVNDVLLSAVAGAIRAYFLQKGETVAGVEVRAMVPVNLRSARDEGTLGNRFGLVTLALPIWEGNPFARLFLVRERMNELKHSFQPPLTLGVLAAVGLAPKLVQQAVPRHAGGQGQRGDDQRAGTESSRSTWPATGSISACSGCRSRATSASASPSSATTTRCSSA